MILKDKTVLITGVGDGLGRECAESAYAQGANLVIAARSEDNLAKIADAIDPSGERVLAHPTDVTDKDACEALIGATVERFGPIHGLAQVAAYESAWGGLYDAKDTDWHAALDVNVLGLYNVLRPAARVMKENGGGSVVVIGSQSMFKPSLPQVGYAASKGALLTSAYYLADELGPDNIRVNMVVPSWMWGPPVEMYVDMLATDGKTREDVLTDITGKFPMRRMAEDGEVADVVTFFLSDLAKAVTGQHLQVNCGELSR
jgi:NAD(P)-dependent dehydrogenase (short-subunit alcohol dehydrogenase family)